MILFPAIDLKDGQCVRLLKGDMDKATVYGDDPAAQARAFQDAGCEWLHIVDLNGAIEGRPVNGPAVDAILNSVSVPIQLGGGIRDLDTIAMWLDKGIRRVILGTVAVEKPEIVREACRQFPKRIVVGIDARGAEVATEGWERDSGVSIVTMINRFRDDGVEAVVYTDIDRDGTLEGPNFDLTIGLAKAAEMKVIASGGVSSLTDLKTLKSDAQKANVNLEGVISGRAIYEGRLDLVEALKVLKND